MSDKSLSQSEIILSRVATCKYALQVRAECMQAVMREIEQYTTPKESHA